MSTNIACGARLCSTCRDFDVRKLLLASAAVEVSDDATVWERLRLSSIEDSPHLYFKQHDSLGSLKNVIETCDLCSSIWRWYSKNGDPARLSDAALAKGLSIERIYLTCTPMNDLWQNFAQLVAFQKGPHDETRVLASFDPYADRDHVPWNNSHLILRSIYSYSGLDGCLRLASGWLQDCEKHKTCRPQRYARPRLPTRVIDVGTKTDGTCTYPRLVKGEARTEPYVALSYCWGGEKALLLSVEAELKLRTGLPVAEFPLTMHHAIIVTRRLGLRYLWIDALCIFQDSVSDWVAESSRMREVYRDAAITISASAAEKPSDGLFCQRTPPASVCRLPWRNDARAQEYVALRPALEVMDAEMRASALNRRAWTLQETLLAPKTLWFGREQLVFECSEGQVNEAGHSTQSTEYYRNKHMMTQASYSRGRILLSRFLRSLGVPAVVQIPYYTLRQSLLWNRRPRLTRDLLILWHWPVHTQGSLLSQSGRKFTFYRQWREIVNRYIERKLTKREDTFPALSGLAEHFARLTGDEYVAGMWKGDLVRCLNWARVLPLYNKDCWESINPSADEDYIAPSWSWASVSGRDNFFSPMQNGAEDKYVIQRLAKVVDVSVQLATADPYGRLKSGKLILRAPFLAIASPQNKPSSNTQYPALQEYLYARETNRLYHTVSQQHRDCVAQQFGILQTCTSLETNIKYPECVLHLLVVESTETGTFRRVARFSLQTSGRLTGSPEDPLRDMRMELTRADWRRKTITLV